MATEDRAVNDLTRGRRPSLLTSLANAAIRRPRRIALAALVFVLLAAVVGAPTVGLLKARDDFQDPSSQSAHAKALIERATGSSAASPRKINSESSASSGNASSSANARSLLA